MKMTRLVDRLTADLATVRPDYVDRVLCPLCLRSFERGALLDKGDDGLSLEHIIPGSLGGTGTSLSCRRCNNKQGSALDANLVRMIRAEDWSIGDGSQLRGKVRIGNTELPMAISWATGEKPRVISILGGKPETLEEFRTMMATMGDGDKVNLSFSFDYAELQARQAFVRMAYLALFSGLGYPYVLSGAGAWVRKLLTEGNIDTLRLLVHQLRDVEETQVKSPIVFSPVADGIVIAAYLLTIRIKTSQRRYYAVLLPASGTPEEACLSVLKQVVNKLGNHLEIRVQE
jgi:hypothetical protein